MRSSGLANKTGMARNLVLCIWLLTVGSASAESEWEKGSYRGKIKFSVNDDGRTMTIDWPFTFTDRKGKDWHVPKGIVTDGASIPFLFWGKIMGSPYTGKHRKAAIVHDHFCRQGWPVTATSGQVHRMFYNAMRVDGVDKLQADLMYGAVYEFAGFAGCKWPVLALRHPPNNIFAVSPGEPERPIDEQMEGLFEPTRKWIESQESESLTMEEIENHIDHKWRP